MAPRRWILSTLALSVLFAAVTLFLADKRNASGPLAKVAEEPISHGTSASALVASGSSPTFTNEKPIPVSEVLPEVERLAAPIPTPKDFSSQSLDHLRTEADQLIRQTDHLLVNQALAPPVLSAERMVEIEKRPEFKASLEHEVILRERLQSLP